MQDIRTVVTATYEPRWNVLAQIPQWTVINEFETEEQATAAALYLFDKFNVTAGVAQAERTYPSIEEMVVALTTRETVETTEQDTEEEYVQAFEEEDPGSYADFPPEPVTDPEAFEHVGEQQSTVERVISRQGSSTPEDFAKSTTRQALRKRGED